MALDAVNINALWAGLAVEELIRNGVDTFVVSPGSRSTPLALAVAGNPRAGVVIHFDERGSAFHALGIAKGAERPVALICTSGTAVANYYPAVVEAARSNVPLILLTADRPPELHDTQANQTINQVDFFRDYARWHATIPCPDRSIGGGYILTTVDHAVYRARRSPSGPVHLNFMFREPLAPTSEGGPFEEYLADLQRWIKDTGPYTSYSLPRAEAADSEMDEVAAVLSSARRGMVFVGQLHRFEEIEAARKLVKALGWPTCPDITSGLRLGPVDERLPLFHHLLLEEPPEPDVILQLGEPVTSKIVLQFLEEQGAEHYILVANHPFRADAAHKVTRRIESNLASFVGKLLPKVNVQLNASWCDGFVQRTQEIESAIDVFLGERKDVSEIAAARIVTRETPADAGLFFGNSMPIRDGDGAGAFDGAGPRVGANRGVSGIDGNIATAAGYARGLKRRVVAVLGDLAVLHDLNSLRFLAGTEAPVVLVVINNNGGGVFSFLPVANFGDHFEEFFGMAHGLTFEKAASMFNVPYVKPESAEEFREQLRHALDESSSSIIEITTDRNENRALHDALTEVLKRVVQKGS